MYCPTCNQLNVPGTEACERCGGDMTALDRPTPHDKVEASLMTESVSCLGPKPPVVVRDDATIGEAMTTMIDRAVGALLVVSGANRLVGILTERDFLTKVAGEADSGTRRVREFMTARPETVSPHDPIAFALQRMDTGGYRHLPVVGDHERPVGVISVRDVLRHITKLCKEGI